MTHALQTPVTSGDRPPLGVAEILNAEPAALSQNLTATPPNALLAAEGASVYVYSSDPAFQSAIEAAAEDRYAITPVEDWSELVTAVERGDCKIVLLDADTMDYYATILIHDPTHAEATTRIGRLVDDLFSQAESALLAESTDRAALALGHIRRVQPENTRLAFLDHQLQRTRADQQDQLVFPEIDLSTSLPVVAAIPSLSELDSLLTVADVRLRNGQLILPSGDSAFDYLQRAAILSPDDPLVLETGADLGEAISASVRIALDSGDLADAERRIGAARELSALAEPLTAFDAEIATIRAMAAEELALGQHAALFADGQNRLQRGQLVTPEQDSAFYYLDALRAQRPDYPNLTESWQQLTARVASNAAQAIGAGDWAAGESWLAALDRIEADPELRSSLGDELSASRLQERYLAVTGPPSELVLLSAESLEYPRNAQQASIEGWVDLEFIVGRDGYVGEISVIGAEPEGHRVGIHLSLRAV